MQYIFKRASKLVFPDGYEQVEQLHSRQQTCKTPYFTYVLMNISKHIRSSSLVLFDENPRSFTSQKPEKINFY